ncbi:MAG: hypothetical protein ACKO40_06190 [Planctomycetaceae bacterium]
MMTRLHALVVLSLVFGAATPRIGHAGGDARPAGGLVGALGQPGRDAEQRAIDAVPLSRMAAAERAIAERTIRRCTLARRLPEATITCDPALVDFVLSKPDTIVDVWRVLGISRLALDPTGPGTWRFSDGYGTAGTVRLLHRERGEHGGLYVFHGTGGYDGSLAPKPLTGSCVVVVRHTVDAAGGRARQTVRIDAFLDVDGMGLELVTRTLQPLIIRSAATNVHEISLFVTQFAAAAARNPAAVSRMADRMTRTSPEDRRRLVALASGAAASRTSMAAGDDVRAELAARWMTAEQLDALQPR